MSSILPHARRSAKLHMVRVKTLGIMTAQQSRCLGGGAITWRAKDESIPSTEMVSKNKQVVDGNRKDDGA